MLAFVAICSVPACSHGCPPKTATKLEECRQRIARDCGDNEITSCPTYKACVTELEGTCQ
jgi:hypothetical protein